MGNNDILLDENSGISIEEQNEILTQINGIAEHNRSHLSQNSQKNQELKAKKSGAFFPLSVNIAAVIIIAAGAFFLISFNLKIDAQARTGSAVYNLTERALIEEIRRDTAEKLAAKDREISIIASRLGEVDTQLLFLQSVFEMTSEQAETQETLLGLRQVYRDDLSLLQEERASILEESRVNEAALRARLEERSKEFTASQQITSGELTSAVTELMRLTSEQDKIAAIDAQVSGGFASLNDIIRNGEYDQALTILENLRGFNNSNSLSASRSFEAKKEFYNQSINSIESLVIYIRNFSYLNNAGILLGERNAQLEQDIDELHKAIDALNTGSDSQARVFSELQDTVSALRASVSSLETSAAGRDRTIASLQSAGAEKDASLQVMQTAGAEKDRTIASLETNAAEKDRTISALESNITERNRTITSLENERTQINQNNANLQTRISAQEQEIVNLRNQIETIRSLLN